MSARYSCVESDSQVDSRCRRETSQSAKQRCRVHRGNDESGRSTRQLHQYGPQPTLCGVVPHSCDAGSATYDDMERYSQSAAGIRHCQRMRLCSIEHTTRRFD